MGVLGVTGATGAEHIDPPTDDAAETPAEGQGQDFVPAAALQPESQASRRERLWRERVEGAIKPLKEDWEKERESHKQALEEERRARQEQAQEMARMRGAFEAMQRQPQQQVTAAPAGPEPDELRRKARESLASGNLEEYERLNAQAFEIVADRKAEAQVKALRTEMQRNQPAQMPPHIQQLMFQSQNVAAAGDKGIRAVIRMEQELEDDGEPAGYARTQKAFKLVNERLGKATAPPARPQFSQEGAAALSGTPPNRAAGAGGKGEEAGVRLTAAQSAAAKAAGMTAEEYTKWGNPHRYGLVK